MVILGFGKVEIDTAYKIINECYEAIEANPTRPEKAVQFIQAQYADNEKKFGSMDRNKAPGRYSYFWFSFHTIYVKKYFIEFTIHHINRQHAFSPDGWALLVTHWMLSVSEEEGKRIFKE